jgi:hypothetical protein
MENTVLDSMQLEETSCLKFGFLTMTIALKSNGWVSLKHKKNIIDLLLK